MTTQEQTNGLTIEGEHTEADVKTTAVDETCVEQIEEMVDHPAFRNPVRVMPDAHAGAGAVIGFTMELGDRVVPNTVGVDIGCGMTAVRLNAEVDPEDPIPDRRGAHMVDEEVRRDVPMGPNVFGDEGHPEQDYHLVNDFPWDECERKLASLEDKLGVDTGHAGYGEAYLSDLCDRVGYDPQRAINSVGTLGGGNHFIEVCHDEDGSVWVVVHSGSRGIGMAIAQHWQDRATAATTSRKSLDDVPDAASDYMTDEWKPDAEAIRTDFEGEAIQEKFDEVSRAIQEHGLSSDDRNTDLDWLEGEERYGYFADMVFAQTYASESRRLMAEAVARVFDRAVEETIESVHNYIDFDDLTIRKGATRVHDGERGVIPFNMRDGSIIVRGKGNPDWNRSAPHGAGRRGSRTWAYDEFDLDEFEAEMEGVFSTSVDEDTLDEAPMAYKDKNVVLDRVEETAEVVSVLTPIHAIKAREW